MKIRMSLCLFALIGLSNTAHAELTRSQITDRKELRALGADIQRIRTDQEEQKEKGWMPSAEIGLSAEYKSGGGTTSSVPFALAFKHNEMYSFTLSTGYIKEFNNGNAGQQGLDDLSLKFSNSDVLAKGWNIHGVSYNVAATAPMNTVGSGSATQSVGGGYEYKTGFMGVALQPLVKVTHFNVSNPGESSWGKNYSVELTSDSRWSTSLSRKVRAGDAGLTEFDLGYEVKFSKDDVFSYEAGYSKTLTAPKSYGVTIGMKGAFPIRW